jgi:uncharacterized lipoprotein YmbA
MTRRQVLASIGLFGALLGGCASSGPTRLYAISPVAAAAAPAPPSAPLAPVRVLEVRLPAAFDRLEMAWLGPSDRIELSDFDRWAAPPGAMAQEAFGRDLELRLPGLTLLPPGSVEPAGGRVVRVVVTSLERGPGGVQAHALLEIRAPAGDWASRSWSASVWVPDDHGSAAWQADLWSRVIAALADQVADRLRGSPSR